jgi:hypothetical protein
MNNSVYDANDRYFNFCEIIDIKKTFDGDYIKQLMSDTGYSKCTIRRMRRVLLRCNEDQRDMMINNEISWREVLKLTSKKRYNTKEKLIKKNHLVHNKNKVLRKEQRYSLDYITGLETLIESLHEQVKVQGQKDREFTSNCYDVSYGYKDNILVVQLADLHLNEEILSIDNVKNQIYNFEVAEKRLTWFLTEIIKIVRAYDINEVYICNTGDMLNSSKKLTELVTNIHPTGLAIMKVVEMIQSFIIKLSQFTFVTYQTVVGNECRFDNRYDQSNYYDRHFMYNNYDYVIHSILQNYFKEYDRKDNRITIAEQKDYKEHMFTVRNQNILMKHGEDLSSKAKIKDCITKYGLEGIKLSLIISGHIHSPVVNDDTVFTRSASLPGGNSYSSKQLNCYGGAGQLMFIVNEKRINRIYVDLTWVQ